MWMHDVYVCFPFACVCLHVGRGGWFQRLPWFCAEAWCCLVLMWLLLPEAVTSVLLTPPPPHPPPSPWAAHTLALACTALQNITITFVLCDCDKRGKEVIFRGCINGFRWGWGGQLDCISEVYLTAWVKLETNTLPWPCTFSQCSSTSTEQF